MQQDAKGVWMIHTDQQVYQHFPALLGSAAGTPKQKHDEHIRNIPWKSIALCHRTNKVDEGCGPQYQKTRMKVVQHFRARDGDIATEILLGTGHAVKAVAQMQPGAMNESWRRIAMREIAVWPLSPQTDCAANYIWPWSCG